LDGLVILDEAASKRTFQRWLEFIEHRVHVATVIAKPEDYRRVTVQLGAGSHFPGMLQ
jgi:hypothetical protein